jgi:hypothetical protein
MRLAQGFATESESGLVIEAAADVRLRNYATLVIDELRSFNPIFYSVVEKEKGMLSNSKLFSACIKGKVLEFIKDDHFVLFREITDKRRRGGNGRIRMITSIDHHTAVVVEEFLAIGVQIKHVAKMHSTQFIASEREVLEIIPEENKLLVENDSSRVRYYLNIFEDLWTHGTDASAYRN